MYLQRKGILHARRMCARDHEMAKERNKRQSGTARNMLDSYMCEYMWRSRLHARDPFETVLQHIVDFWPPA